MTTRPPQSYENHVRKVPKGYWATCLALLFGALGLAWVAFRHPGIGTVSALLVALGASGAAWYARINALLVQDRLIRLEERIRLERLLPTDLALRISDFSFDQIAAMRFASDDELPELARAVLAEGIEDRKAIKQRVRSWRADWMRV
ncbi:MAG: DUF6526 family protein [Thermoanaerobaculia bacterium]